MDCVAGFAVGHDFAPHDWETNESRSEPASGRKTDGSASGLRTEDRRAGAQRPAAGLPGCTQDPERWALRRAREN